MTTAREEGEGLNAVVMMSYMHEGRRGDGPVMIVSVNNAITTIGA